MSLLLHATIRHPELPIFPPDVHDLIPEQPSTKDFTSSLLKPALTPQPQQTLQPPQSITSPPNGHGSTDGTPRSQPFLTSGSEIDPAEAQLLGEINRSHPVIKAQNAKLTATVESQPTVTTTNNGSLDRPNEYDDGYDTDPPAHYPRAGNGLARTMRPESEDLNWLVDDNFEVFSHGWKGDGSGLGADGILGDTMEGVENGKA